MHLHSAVEIGVGLVVLRRYSSINSKSNIQGGYGLVVVDEDNDADAHCHQICVATI
jgi:hypothetical protein